MHNVSTAVVNFAPGYARDPSAIRPRSNINPPPLGRVEKRAPDCPCTRRCLSCSLCYGIYMFWYYYCPLLHSYIGNTRMARWISRPRPFAGETCLRAARWATSVYKTCTSLLLYSGETFFVASFFFVILDVNTRWSVKWETKTAAHSRSACSF